MFACDAMHTALPILTLSQGTGAPPDNSQRLDLLIVGQVVSSQNSFVCKTIIVCIAGSRTMRTGTKCSQMTVESLNSAWRESSGAQVECAHPWRSVLHHKGVNMEGCTTAQLDTTRTAAVHAPKATSDSTVSVNCAQVGSNCSS